MSGVASAAVDLLDRTVDAVRAALGLPPLPPQLLKLTFDRPPTVRVPVTLRVETRRAVHSFLRIEQGDAILIEGAAPTGMSA